MQCTTHVPPGLGPSQATEAPYHRRPISCVKNVACRALLHAGVVAAVVVVRMKVALSGRCALHATAGGHGLAQAGRGQC